MRDLTDTGWDVTALMVEGKSLPGRLFNAEGDESPQEVRFDGNPSKVELVELSGEVRSRLETLPKTGGNTTVKTAIPRFGMGTLRFSGMGPVPLHDK